MEPNRRFPGAGLCLANFNIRTATARDWFDNGKRPVVSKIAQAEQATYPAWKIRDRVFGRPVEGEQMCSKREVVRSQLMFRLTHRSPLAAASMNLPSFQATSHHENGLTLLGW